ncbi:ATP synthase subunit I [Alteromonas sp. RKMC-009]|uniref:ATP synthase subunit I n=1 Tax=Alteromonas sp. RKMC-009 TaxID=2267264 RepID=UPI001E2D3DC6|nr:ATP synthase subunit I [Alteromonas sp. RKMC-009]
MTLLVIISAWAMSVEVAKSAAIGAFISILPNAIFALFAFRYSGASKNELVVRSFSQGAKLRLVLAVILFVVAFKFLHAIPEAVFAAFAVTTVSYWLAMFRQQKR